MAVENEIAKVLLRRWYFVLLGLLATVGLCFAAVNTTPTSYEASARFSVLPPYATGANPYLDLNNLAPLTDLLATTATSDSAVNALRDKGIAEEYIVTRDVGASGAVILVVGSGATPKRALEVTKAVAATLPGTLAQIQEQANVSTANSATLKPVASDAKATEITKKRKRKVILAAGVGIVFTGLISLGADRLLRARKRRKAQRQQDRIEGGGPADAPDEHPEQDLVQDELDPIRPTVD